MMQDKDLQRACSERDAALLEAKSLKEQLHQRSSAVGRLTMELQQVKVTAAAATSKVASLEAQLLALHSKYVKARYS